MCLNRAIFFKPVETYPVCQTFMSNVNRLMLLWWSLLRWRQTICNHQADSIVTVPPHKPTQIAKIMGPTWGPPGSCRPQMGPMLGTWILLSGKLCTLHTYCITVVKKASLEWCREVSNTLVSLLVMGPPPQLQLPAFWIEWLICIAVSMIFFYRISICVNGENVISLKHIEYKICANAKTRLGIYLKIAINVHSSSIENGNWNWFIRINQWWFENF